MLASESCDGKPACRRQNGRAAHAGSISAAVPSYLMLAGSLGAVEVRRLVHLVAYVLVWAGGARGGVARAQATFRALTHLLSRKGSVACASVEALTDVYSFVWLHKKRHVASATCVARATTSEPFRCGLPPSLVSSRGLSSPPSGL